MTRPTWVKRLTTTVGWRGFFLLCFGCFDLAYGWTKMIHPDEVSARSQQLQLIGELFPWIGPSATVLTWGYLWWAAGIMCLVNAFRLDDWWGYGAAIGVKVSWLCANLWAWNKGLVGGGSTVTLWVFVLIVAVGLALRPETVHGLEKMVDRIEEIERLRREVEGDDDDRIGS